VEILYIKKGGEEEMSQGGPHSKGSKKKGLTLKRREGESHRKGENHHGKAISGGVSRQVGGRSLHLEREGGLGYAAGGKEGPLLAK